MAETLSTLSIIFFAVAGVCLIIAVFLFVYFKIPSVVGDLSGRTARKSIAKMRVANEKTGSKSYNSSKTNMDRGKLTGTVKDFGEIVNKIDEVADDRPETGLLSDNKAEHIDSQATGLLEDEATGLLMDENATALLNETKKTVRRSGGKKLNLVESVMLIHTDEVI